MMNNSAMIVRDVNYSKRLMNVVNNDKCIYSHLYLYSSEEGHDDSDYGFSLSFNEMYYVFHRSECALNVQFCFSRNCLAISQMPILTTLRTQ